MTDGKFVYASFGSRGVYCYDFNGKLIWEKDLCQAKSPGWQAATFAAHTYER